MNIFIFILLIIWLIVLSNKIGFLHERADKMKDYANESTKKGNELLKALQDLAEKVGYVVRIDWIVKMNCFGEGKAVKVLKVEESSETKARNHFMEEHLLPSLEKLADSMMPKEEVVDIKKRKSSKK